MPTRCSRRRKQGEVNQDQTLVVLRALRAQQKVLTGDDPPLAAAYVRARAWDTDQTAMTTEELRQAFARRLRLPILLDLNQLKKTVQNGIQTRQWVYYDAAAGVGYDHESPPPAVQVSDEVYFYLPEEAARRGLPIRGKMERERGPGPEPTCPLCGRPRSGCICGEVVEEIPPPPEPLRGEGVPSQAFQQLMDRCADRGVTRLTVLRITLTGEGAVGARNLRTLGLVIPQMGRGEYRIEQRYGAEFGDGQYISSEVRLNWDLYRRWKAATDDLSQAAEKFTTKTVLTVRFPEGLEVGGRPVPDHSRGADNGGAGPDCGGGRTRVAQD